MQGYTEKAIDPPAPGPAPLGRWTLLLIIAFCLLGVASAVVYVSLPLGSVTYDTQGNVTQASFLRPGLYDSLSSLFLTCLPTLLVPGVILLAHRRKRLGVWCVVASLWLTGSLWSLGPLRLRADWVIMGRVGAAAGQEYLLIAQRGAPSQMAGARLASTGRMYETADLLAPPVPMPQIPVVMLIRPTPLKSTNPGGLFLTCSDLLVWVDYESVCHIVYDVSKRRFYNEDEIEHLSPFILIDEKSSLYVPDETAIISELTSTKNYRRGLPPTTETLSQALNHPNPAVRQSAARLLKYANPTTSP